MIDKIRSVPFVRNGSRGLEQQVIIHLQNPGQELKAVISLVLPGTRNFDSETIIPSGEFEYKAFIPELQKKQQVTCIVRTDIKVLEQRVFTVSPSRRWRVHVVQLSHHDLGYTGLPSNVLSKHERYLDHAMDMADATTDFPDDAKFRIVIEQAWSVEYFLKHARPERAEKMIRLMQSGQFELTALFGNMTTEICGHESLIRALYPSFRLKRKYGIPIISAEHNDITGFSWGLCRVLCDAGVKIFCPGLPLYYNWAETPYRSFWDQEAVIGFEKLCVPGAFWWEAADGKRILFWCNNKGCGGSADPQFPGLGDALEGAEKSGFSGSVMRWPVQGGSRDNSPYIIGFAEAIKKWNETWEYPKLISSTNARFHEEFYRTIPDDLPVRRGELPGQDYPVGAMSTARPTALNRNSHQDLITAEKLAVFAKTATDYEYQAYELENAYEDTMAFEEHAWGHLYSHGSAMTGAEAEKAVHACRAAAYAHDVRQKAIAMIADNIEKKSDDIHLLVFNPLAFARDGLVRMPMREIENSEIVMVDISGGRASSSLQGRKERTHLILPEEMISGYFELLDAETYEKVDYQLLKISADDPVSTFAAQRAALAQGRKTYFNHPYGWDYDCCFVVRSIPAMGYRCYLLRRTGHVGRQAGQTDQTSQTNHIENEFYRVAVDGTSGKVVSIFDKDSGRELIDSNAPHSFGEIIVRSPSNDKAGSARSAGKAEIVHGDIVSSISTAWSTFGHPAVQQKLLLYKGVKRIDLAVRILKDSTPLLDAHLAFPFAMEKPEFRYEGTLNVLKPVKDFLPGAYSDALTIQNWAEIRETDFSLIWSSQDSPVAAFGQLWPGYVSPAHSCVVPERMRHLPQKEGDFRHGWIYSTLFNNNFCTNFSVTQSGEFIFRYSMTTFSKSLSVPKAVMVGADLLTSFEHIFTSARYQGKLPLSGAFIKIENKDIVLLDAKLADDGKGIVMRFWNPTGNSISSKIECPFLDIDKVCAINNVEELTGQEIESGKNHFDLEIKRDEVVSVCVSEKSWRYRVLCGS
jgi:hypothetical protein